jgi:N-acetylmuramoyl-L-alanine amidase
MFMKVTAVALSLSLFAGAGMAKASTTEHEVVKGDTVYKISKKYGVPMQTIGNANNLANLNLIYVGQVLKIGEATSNSNVVENNSTSVTDAEFDLLARIVTAEAKGEPYIGQIAVANVIMNRVADETFPNDIKSVIYQSGQFSPVSNGTINQPATEVSKQAVRDALNGTNEVGDALFFWATYVPKDSWVWTKPVIKQIGNHVFAK